MQMKLQVCAFFKVIVLELFHNLYVLECIT
jgi:hypothetical protein